MAGYVFTIPMTITTAGTSSTFTFTVLKRREPPKPPEKVDPLAFLRDARQPEALRPVVYGTCPRCSVNLDVEAFGGRCSVCGGSLRVG